MGNFSKATTYHWMMSKIPRIFHYFEWSMTVSLGNCSIFIGQCPKIPRICRAFEGERLFVIWLCQNFLGAHGLDEVQDFPRIFWHLGRSMTFSLGESALPFENVDKIQGFARWVTACHVFMSKFPRNSWEICQKATIYHWKMSTFPRIFQYFEWSMTVSLGKCSTFIRQCPKIPGICRVCQNFLGIHGKLVEKWHPIIGWVLNFPRIFLHLGRSMTSSLGKSHAFMSKFPRNSWEFCHKVTTCHWKMSKFPRIPNILRDQWRFPQGTPALSSGNVQKSQNL